MRTTSHIMNLTAALGSVIALAGCTSTQASSSAATDPVDYVSTLVGTQSKHSLST